MADQHLELERVALYMDPKTDQVLHMEVVAHQVVEEDGVRVRKKLVKRIPWEDLSSGQRRAVRNHVKLSRALTLEALASED